MAFVSAAVNHLYDVTLSVAEIVVDTARAGAYLADHSRDAPRVSSLSVLTFSDRRTAPLSAHSSSRYASRYILHPSSGSMPQSVFSIMWRMICVGMTRFSVLSDFLWERAMLPTTFFTSAPP